MGDLSFYKNFQVKYTSDEVYWYWDLITSKIIAESGIPTDNHHTGKILMSVLKDNPDRICQIDGATDQHYTNREVLEKSVRCAAAFRNTGIQKGDVIAILGPNHLDLTIPFYACFFIGAIAAGLDRTLRAKELSHVFTRIEPKIIICQNEKFREVQQAVNEGKVDARIVTFDIGGTQESFSEFLNKYGGQETVEEFKATDFDPVDTVAYLLSTSGTTGLPKLAAITHKTLSIGGRQLWSNYTNFPTPTRMYLNLSPLQWLSAIIMHATTPILGIPRLQTSAELTQDHFYHLLRKYKPTVLLTSPNLMTSLMKSGEHDLKDLQCLQNIYLGGSAVLKKQIEQIKEITPNTTVTIAYGLSEISALGFNLVNSPMGCVGTPTGCFKYRLVDTETNEVINEPNVPGELWLKSPFLFKGYYNNPEETAKVFSDDGWLMTGDVFYKDAHNNYFFCDRQKLLLKYMNHQEITPNTTVTIAYGLSEISALGFNLVNSPMGCVGTPTGCFKYRLVDTETNEVINEPNVPGELWLKSPFLFKGYYNNPEETAKVFSDDGWLMTGDVFYKDAHNNYFFCDRQKLLLKYMNHQISPAELENVIRSHPAVHDVAVTGRPNPHVGDLAVACVVTRPGCDVSSEEIQDLVKENLTESKQLRGGVVFLKEMPLLPSGKINRQKLKTLVSHDGRLQD